MHGMFGTREVKTMALRYENECVGCPPERGCMGSACPFQNVPIWSCDNCGEEDEPIYEFDGKELCIKCIKELLTQVN